MALSKSAPTDVHVRRTGEAERATDRLQVQRVHVEHLPQAVRRVRAHVRLEALHRRLVQQEVAPHELLELREQSLRVLDVDENTAGDSTVVPNVVLLLVNVEHLRLDVGHFGPAELVLLKRHARLAEQLEEAALLRPQVEQRVADGVLAASGAPDAVDVVFGVVWRVELHDPVDARDVEAARGHVGAQHNGRRRLAELQERGGALRLLLLALSPNELRFCNEYISYEYTLYHGCP